MFEISIMFEIEMFEISFSVVRLKSLLRAFNWLHTRAQPGFC